MPTNNNKMIIDKVKNDINLLGGSFKVIAVYDNDVVRRYIAALPPSREQNVCIDDYEKMMEKYKSNIDTLVGTKSAMFSLAELLDKLIEQNKII